MPQPGTIHHRNIYN